MLRTSSKICCIGFVFSDSDLLGRRWEKFKFAFYFFTNSSSFCLKSNVLGVPA